MKKLFSAVLFVLAFVLGAQAQTTPTLHLNLPPHGYQPYDVPINANFSIIDQAFTQLLNQYQGTWSNTQAYTQSQIVAFGTAPNVQTYIALASSTGQEPDTATGFWALLGGSGSGGGGGGGGFTLNQYEIGSNTGGGTPILSHTNHYVLPTGLTTSQINAIITARPTSVIEIQNGDARTQFANPKTISGNTYYMGTKIQDNRTDVNGHTTPVTDKGAACDRRLGAFQVSVANGASVMTGAAWFTSALTLGKTFVFVGNVGGTPTAYEPKVTSFVNASTVNLDTAAPFAITNTSNYYYGTDDTAAIAQTFTDASVSNQGNNVGAMAVSFPAGVCMSHTITLNGVAWQGLNPTLSKIHFFPGEDGFATPDPAVFSAQNGGNDVNDHDVGITIDNSIDATLPWQLVANGTTVSVPAMYRPTGVKTIWANNPLSAPWLGASPGNGVAAVTNGSASIAIQSSETVPANGAFLVFPYANGGIFVTTVLSQSGHTVTMNNIYPGTTAAQAEWFTGSSPQKTTVDFPNSGTRTYPFTLQVFNPTYYDPKSESGLAPFGLVQIGNEQCNYFYNSRVSPYSLRVVSCTGTVADHPVGSYLQPLNPFKPQYPWPVIPSINAGDTTPTLASFYPAFNVGAAGLSSPISNGTSVAGTNGIFAFSHIHDLVINFTHNLQNSAAGMYMVQLPYKTQFSQILIDEAFYGIEEGVPSINNHNYFAAQPTADATTFDGITIRAVDIMNVIGGANTHYSNFDAYTAAGGLPYPISAGAVSGYAYSFGWDDQNGGTAQFISASYIDNMYLEPENPGGLMPLNELDCYGCEIHSWINHGGGDFLVGGANAHFYSTDFNNSVNEPLVNYGPGTTSDEGSLLGTQPKSNVYHTGAVLNYAPQNTSLLGTTDSAFASATGPQGSTALGGRAPLRAQTGETFTFGNLTQPVTSLEDGLIYPDEFNTSFAFESQAANAGFNFDDTAPVSHTSVGCSVGNNPNANYCLSFAFNQNNIPIGKGQRIVPGLYNLAISMKDDTTANNTATVTIGSSCTGVLNRFTFPITNSWPSTRAQWFTAQVDFSSATAAGCSFQFGWEGDGTSDVNRASIVALTPVPEFLSVQNINYSNITNTYNPSSSGGNGVGCLASPVLGINQGFTCPQTGWVTTLSTSQNSSQTTAVLGTISGVLTNSPGCFVVDSEIECYTAVSGSTLTGVQRGAYATTPASHTASAGISVSSVAIILGSPLQTPGMVITNGAVGTPLIGINVATPAYHSSGAHSVLGINAGNNEVWFSNLGAIHQVSGSDLNTFGSPVQIGVLPNGNTSIISSQYVVQTNGLNELVQAIGLGGGHAGTLKVIPAPTLGAPTLLNFSTGTGATTWTYVCTGTDYDGNLVNGTSASIPSLPASTLTGTQPFIGVTCPVSAGLASMQIYRTAGGSTQGLIASGGNALQINDNTITGNSVAAPSVNGSNPSVQVQGTSASGIGFGTISGVFTFTSTPVACGSTYPNSSIGINVNGTTSSNTIYQCNGTTWNSIGSGGGGGVANLLASGETVSFSATPTFSITLNSSEITLTANITSFTLAAGSQGQVKVLVFCQNGTGNFTVTRPSNVHALAVGSVASKCSTDNLIYSSAASAWLLTGSYIDQ